ncbi:hypothetical protein SCP_1500980 [Sparassis crispa]|uniref:Uncharacterized protein n=1 Tax=Sparassis crispa TaxID=139825 RepID=A0A401H3T0_9APHY|nr:hypothetical protein SCP_1500980 [Sparassis crispa]GBE89095.1 hypothetical protein SCP_1500980 [Sparassis crispa]
MDIAGRTHAAQGIPEWQRIEWLVGCRWRMPRIFNPHFPYGPGPVLEVSIAIPTNMERIGVFPDVLVVSAALKNHFQFARSKMDPSHPADYNFNEEGFSSEDLLYMFDDTLTVQILQQQPLT